MERRDFIRRSAAVAGAASVLGALPAAAEEALVRRTGAGAPTPEGGAATGGRPEGQPQPISEAERAERRSKAQRLMAERKIDGLFIEPGANLLYFTGIRWGRSERLFGMLLPVSGDAAFVVPAFEAERAEGQIAGRYPVQTWQEDASPYRLIADTLAARGVRTGTVAVDESARFFVAHELAQAAPRLTITMADEVTHLCRGVKTAHEIAIMRHANQVTLEAYRTGLKTLREGMTQSELSRAVTEEFRKLGYDGYAMVLFGEGSAYPHGSPNPRPLRAGDVVLIDGGCTVLGYEADITRTVVFGTPTAEQQKVFDTVRAAQRAALGAARPGARAGDVDAAARKIIADAGFGGDYKALTHRLGHGIGMEGHEWPYLVRGSDVVLRPGMTFSDEPGIYQYGKFGLRLEDIMAVTESGAELLTPPARSLSTALEA